VGGVDAPIINPSQHGAMNHHGTDLSMPVFWPAFWSEFCEIRVA
jgi:hypothetical protein